MALPCDENNQTFRRYEDGGTAYASWQDHILQSGQSHKCPTYVHRTPPCQNGCHAGEDIRGWLAIARGLDKADDGTPWQERAFYRLTQANPFPALMGRVCPAPCQDACNREEVEQHVNINAVEQHIGDYAIANGLAFDPPKTETGKHVAVVGGGVAGLTCAYFLRRRGHAVTLYEAYDRLGGMLAFGLPEHRTRRDKVDAEIQRILDMGVDARTGVRVGQDIDLETVDARHDAVFWAIGLQKGRELPIPGWQESPNCVTALQFLRAFNEGRLRHVPKRVVVIGGGDTTVDVATNARRLGARPDPDNDFDTPFHDPNARHADGTDGVEAADVLMTSVLSRTELTAQDFEMAEAEAEGVQFRFGVVPREILRDADGRAVGLRMAECHVEPGMKIVPHDDTEFDLEADLIVSAIGQTSDLAGLEDLTGGKDLIPREATCQVRQRPGHFVGGDITGPALLVTAIGHGRIAAEGIDHFLGGRPLPNRPKIDKARFSMEAELCRRHLAPETPPEGHVRGTFDANFAIHNYEDRSDKELITADRQFLAHFKCTPRNDRGSATATGERVRGFEERLEPFTDEQAVSEAGRCMSCGLCLECDNCVIYCPQDAVYHLPKTERARGRYVATDYARCVGCHVCADVCPSGYIEMGLGE